LISPTRVAVLMGIRDKRNTTVSIELKIHET